MRRAPVSGSSLDPFAERGRPRFSEHAQLLGGRFVFETDSARALKIVRSAYGSLPAHRFRARPSLFRVRLIVTRNCPPRVVAPPMQPLAAQGILCGATLGSAFASISPATRSALIVLPEQLLSSPYNVRYELLEFAVYTLAARVQGLVPLHAACVARDDRAVLLLGPTGSGKSTLTLQCLQHNWDFLAEDSVLVEPHSLRAAGIGSFLHLRANSLRFLNATEARAVRASPVIRRRSGVSKFELDLRHGPWRLARTPTRIMAMVFLSAAAPTERCRLIPLDGSATRTRLAAEQPYAVGQPGWAAFSARACALPAFALRRGRHPRESVSALEELLAGSDA
jgi:hypothetical protein